MRFLLYIKIGILFIILWSNGSVVAQNVKFDIKAIKLNKETRTLDIDLYAVKNNSPILLDATKILIEETREKIYRDFTEEISDITPMDQVKTELHEQVTILFLIDLSGSMRGEKVETAKSAIRNTLSNTKFPPGTKVFLSTFHDDIFPSESTSWEVTGDNLEGLLKDNVFIDPFPYGKETDLYRAMITKIDEYSSRIGKKAIILLSDGENSIVTSKGIMNYVYSPDNPNRIDPFTAEDVYNKLQQADSSLLIFPVGLGNEVDVPFLNKMTAITPDTMDAASFTDSPTQLGALFTNVVSEFAANYKIKVQPPQDRAIFNGTVRNLEVIWQSGDTAYSAVKSYQFGTQNAPIDLRSKPPTPLIHWINLFLGGLIVVFGVLAILVLIVPFFRKKNFREKFVKQYAKEGNLKKSDPITLEPFENGDWIVDCCKTMMALDTWEHNGNQCVNYPGCLNDAKPCEGRGGNTGHEKFFSQKGIYRKLNWFWFGALGGLIAWFLYAIFQNINMDWFAGALESLVNTSLIKTPLQGLGAFDNISQNMDTLSYQVLDGIGLGFGLCFSLALVEEMGQARKISIGRILLRTFLGMMLALIVFTIGFLIQYSILPNAYVTGLLTWTIFGLVIGVVLSIKSTINFGKGILGGLIAGFVAFHLYYGVTTLDHDLWPLAKLVGFILLGGILGVIIVAVVSRYEDFELEYVEPAKYRKINPISKWLKAGMDIFLGTDSSCYVYVSWADPAIQPQHALLSYDTKKNLVYIEPQAETLINNKVIPLDQKTELQDGDLIQPGRNSVTKMRFKVKKPPKRSGNTSSSDNGSAKKSNPFKKQPEKRKIKITKRED